MRYAVAGVLVGRCGVMSNRNYKTFVDFLGITTLLHWQGDEPIRLEDKKTDPANSEGTAGMPNREGDNEGQTGVDETKHN